MRMARRFWGALAGAGHKERRLLRVLPFSPSLSHAGLWNQLPRTKQHREQWVGKTGLSPLSWEEGWAVAVPLLGRVLS